MCCVCHVVLSVALEHLGSPEPLRTVGESVVIECESLVFSERSAPRFEVVALESPESCVGSGGRSVEVVLAVVGEDSGVGEIDGAENGFAIGLRHDAVLNVWPSVLPVDAHEPHLASLFGIASVVAVHGHPVGAFIVGHDFGIVSRSGNEGVAVNHCLVIAVEQTVARLGVIGSEEAFGASIDHGVCALCALAACSCRTEEVVVVAAFVYVCALHEVACYAELLCSGLHTESVVAEFNAPDAVE